MQVKITCPKCGAPNAQGNQFCLVCGEALQFSCPNCGNAVDPSMRFCQTCGAGQGWGARVREIQNQLSRTEGTLAGILSQNSFEIRSQLDKNEQNIRGSIAQYSSDLQSQQAKLNETAKNINQMLYEERGMRLSRTLNRIGLGVMALGLAVIGLSYVFSGIPNLGGIGAIVVAVGFLVQLASNFL
jgi:hypothetical protein